MTIRIENTANLAEAAGRFLEAAGDKRLFAFRGPMGVGKTTFIAAVCRALGASDDFGSPTFSLLNEYADAGGDPVYHFDFYRLESPEEALDMGVEDYFYSGNWCFMEWPEKIGSLLPPETVDVYIEELADGTRLLKICG